MRQLKAVDVVIAGGGFVGLTLAKEITARTSLSVVVVERGQPRKLSDYAAGMDELVAENGEIKVPLRFFTTAEGRVVEAACDCIFPSDATGPGSREAGVVVYIDRQLAGPYGRDKYRYTQPPFVESVPELPRGTKPA